MTLHRRAIALLTGLLTLQLTLAGDLVLCADGAGVTSGIAGPASNSDMAGMDMTGMDMTGMDMTGMDMAGMDMAGMDMAADASEAADTPAPPAPSEPCNEWLPSRGCDLPIDGQECAAMLACAAAAISIMADVTLVDATRLGDAPISGVILPGLSRSTAPESPPPRA